MPLLYVERQRIPNSDMKTLLLFFSAVHFILLLHTDVIHAEYTGEYADYITEAKSECHFMNGTQRVRFLDRYFYNQEEYVYFDSDVGYYIAKTELGRPDAEGWNKNKEILEDKRANVQRFCIHNYDVLHSVTADRRVEPKVKISLMAQHEDADSELHILVCNVYGFYPPEIEVNWYRNDQMESTQVVATDIFRNGDWTYQVIVNLQTEIKKGDNFSCEVTHSSLQTPVQVDWQPQISDSAKNKVVTGVVGFVLGTILIIAGVVVYVRGRKAQMTFRGPQTEHFIHT